MLSPFQTTANLNSPRMLLSFLLRKGGITLLFESCFHELQGQSAT